MPGIFFRPFFLISIIGLNLFAFSLLYPHNEKPAEYSGVRPSADWTSYSLHGPLEEITYNSEDPLQVLVAGDSLVAFVMEQIMAADLCKESCWDLDVIRVPGSGFTYPKFFDWTARIQSLCDEVKAGKDRKDVAVFFLGSNDAQNMGLSDRSLVFGSEEWIAEYKQRMRDMLDPCFLAFQKIIWTTIPPMQDGRFEQQMSVIRSVQAEVLSGYSGVTVVNTREILGDLQGRFRLEAHSAEQVKYLRYNDGIHLYYDGARMVFQEIRRKINGLFLCLENQVSCQN